MAANTPGASTWPSGPRSRQAQPVRLLQAGHR